jgi:hypothetical protein
MVGLRRPGSVSYRPLEVGAPELDDVAGQHAQRDPARHHFRDQLSPDVVAVGVGRAAGPVERLGVEASQGHVGQPPALTVADRLADVLAGKINLS